MAQHLVASYEITVLPQLYPQDLFYFSLFTSYKLYGAWKRASSLQNLLFLLFNSPFFIQIILWKLTLSVVSLLVAGEATDKESSNSRIILEVVRAFLLLS